MIKIEETEVVGLRHAIRGMRNPMNSWEQSDSGICKGGDQGIGCENCSTPYDHAYDHEFKTGKEDYYLMEKLRDAGTDHRKYLRMIVVYLDITAPLYWWKEFDTYKVGTVANSCSTMHEIHKKEFILEDFSCEHLMDELDFERTFKTYLETTIEGLNEARDKYLETNDKFYWWQMIQLLPSSYNQKRTAMLNYEVLTNLYKSHRNNKLDEWHTFYDWVETLPYSELITGKGVHI